MNLNIFEKKLGDRTCRMANLTHHDIKYDGGRNVIVCPKSGITLKAPIVEFKYIVLNGVKLWIQEFVEDPSQVALIQSIRREYPGVELIGPQIVGRAYGEHIWCMRPAESSELSQRVNVKLMDFHNFNVYPKKLFQVNGPFAQLPPAAIS
jgi:hypothetical protein